MATKKTSTPPRPKVKEWYGPISPHHVINNRWEGRKQKVPTTKLKETKVKALKSKRASEIQTQVEEFAKSNGVPVSEVTLIGTYNNVYMRADVPESDEAFNRRVNTVVRNNKLIDQCKADIRAQKAWDKKYAKPAPAPTLNYNTNSQVLLQTVINDPEIAAIISRKYGSR